MPSTTDKTRETRLRRMADRQRLQLVKSKRRDPRAADFGRYWLNDPWNSNAIVAGGESGITLDEVEEHLTGEPS